MLPNFRKTDPDAARGQLTAAANDQVGIFPPRGFQGTEKKSPAVSVIGPDLIIQGNLVSKGEVQVEGTIEGDVHGSHIVVGQTANITGGIVAEEIVIRGHVSGSVRGKRVMLQASSQVDGDIFHNALSIEQGAMFEGKSRRTKDDPREGVPVGASPPTRRKELHASAYDIHQDTEEEALVTIVPPRLPGN